jgi:hypothetical protein
LVSGQRDGRYDLFYQTVRRCSVRWVTKARVPAAMGLGRFPDYVGIENRQVVRAVERRTWGRPVDIPMMQTYGAYPRYRLLVTYFIEKKGWSVEQLLDTRLTSDEAVEIMRADQKRKLLPRAAYPKL